MPTPAPPAGSRTTTSIPAPGAGGVAAFLWAAAMQMYRQPSQLSSYALVWLFINSYATVIAGSLLFWYWLRRGLVGREEAVSLDGAA